MDKLFTEAVRIDENRSVGVEELADGTIGIRGVTIDPHTGEASIASIRFSPESTKALRVILDRLSSSREEEKK